VNVVDTAGLRHTDDPIEQEGVKLALSRIAEADLVIFLYDASLGWTEEDQQMLNLVQEEKASWRDNMSTAISRILYFNTFPAAFMGNSVTNLTYRGVLCFAILERTYS